jgi:hypothetical protein
MKKLSVFFSIALLVFGLSFWNGSVAMAVGEHGGKEHGGHEHGGAASVSSDAQTLLEAAEELMGTNPALASKLKSIAKKV